MPNLVDFTLTTVSTSMTSDSGKFFVVIFNPLVNELKFKPTVFILSYADVVVVIER